MSAAEEGSGLTHIGAEGAPRIVDVGGKQATHRTAHAQTRVRLPRHVAQALRDGGFATPKGPVFQTATLAGIMAAKKTSDLIPLCHPLPLENCTVDIALGEDDVAVIDCRASIHHKTGVEMEALTGATVAALTIYDMCKAMSHDIVIEGTRLLAKAGGRRDFERESEDAS